MVCPDLTHDVWCIIAYYVKDVNVLRSTCVSTRRIRAIDKLCAQQMLQRFVFSSGKRVDSTFYFGQTTMNLDNHGIDVNNPTFFIPREPSLYKYCPFDIRFYPGGRLSKFLFSPDITEILELLTHGKGIIATTTTTTIRTTNTTTTTTTTTSTTFSINRMS
jgi:hypothetical protein